jgi:hypothetical protein
MGLDMYLTRKISIFDYHVKLEPKNNMPPLEVTKASYLLEDFGYWRKANHIHNWFINNVQNGDDDCGEYFISKEKLDELAHICHQVLDDKKTAKDLLPTTSGFFFGSTEYDEYYFEAVKYTLDICQKALGLFDQQPHSTFYYQSSW